MKLIKSLFIVFSFFFLNIESFAQKIEIGGGLGAMNYKGDISPDFHPSFAQLGGHLLFRYNLKKDVTFRLSTTFGSIYGNDKEVSDSFNQQRGQTFKTSIKEVSLVTEYNFFSYQYSRMHKDWSPYVFGGIGFMGFSPRDTPVSDYKQAGVIIPFGVGIKYNLTGPWDLNLEFGTRKTFTDYLDNLGGDNPALSRNIQNDYSRGDMYYYTSLALTYKFIKIYCPK
ncbi:outer membrane protein with beta-barrel domain [Arcicella aurantiaca]|uniref:Outer membrane protein with beta-barrel domain n=1 Tax=Arcicella aurantiaca TaxID=591202 RepID=A0A316EDJ0_9BACT|nr:DUF6089 family protein [Arcicella aurantiaca]PWK28606.1 outer membrane protein with beta-barrel domain [Arcicella aurantiaca]